MEKSTNPGTSHGRVIEGRLGLDYLDLGNLNNVYWNLTPAETYEQSILRGEGTLSSLGPIVVRTGGYTGRSPNDKFIVKEAGSEDKIWWGKVNRPIEEKQFDQIWSKMQNFLNVLGP